MMDTDLVRGPEANKEIARTEAFSDGVIAVAITLLVLDIRVPRDLPVGTGLLAALLAQWPNYLAFLTSFVTILIMWINHHRMFKYVKRVDHWFMVLNGALLLCITIVPFSTSLVAEYILRDDRTLAVLVYTGMFTLISVVFNAMWWYASHNHRLLDEKADQSWITGITQQYRFGPVMYLFTMILALFNIWISLIVNAALAIFYLLPPRTSSGQ